MKNIKICKNNIELLLKEQDMTMDTFEVRVARWITPVLFDEVKVPMERLSMSKLGKKEYDMYPEVIIWSGIAEVLNVSLDELLEYDNGKLTPDERLILEVLVRLTNSALHGSENWEEVYNYEHKEEICKGCYKRYLSEEECFYVVCSQSRSSDASKDYSGKDRYELLYLKGEETMTICHSGENIFASILKKLYMAVADSYKCVRMKPETEMLLDEIVDGFALEKRKKEIGRILL